MMYNEIPPSCRKQSCRKQFEILHHLINDIDTIARAMDELDRSPFSGLDADVESHLNAEINTKAGQLSWIFEELVDIYLLSSDHLDEK